MNVRNGKRVFAAVSVMLIACVTFLLGWQSPAESPTIVKAAATPISGDLTLAQHKALYEEDYRAASDLYHANHGFDPTSGKVVTVDSYSTTTSSANQWGYGFVEAYSDETVTKIIMLNNISSPTTGSGSIYDRKSSIEIDGSGYQLTLIHRNLGIGSPAAGTNPVFHLHDVKAATNTSYGYAEAAGYWSFVGGSESVVHNLNYRGQWYFRFGNVSTDYDASKYAGNNTSYTTIGGRFARVNQAEVTMYGYNDLVTGSENFYLGSVVVEDNTIWKGTNCTTNYSVVWMVDRQKDDTTGISGEFTIGDNAFVYLRNTTSYTTYPAIYAHYSTITVGEGAYYNANMQGRAVSNFDGTSAGGVNRYATKQFIAKKNSNVNLLSRGTGSVLKMDHSGNGINADMQFKAESGAKVFIYGSTTAGVVSMAGSGSVFELNAPSMFEIRNSSSSSFLNTSAGNTFSIKDSDINTWKNATSLTNPSDYSYEKVGDLTIAGTAVTSTDSGLQSTLTTTGFRRINGLNTPPSIVWDYVTDADKSYQAKVSLGDIPTGQFDDNGVAIMTEAWAVPGQAVVTFTDTHGNIRTPIAIQSDGYAKYTDTDFQLAEMDMEGSATRGISWLGDISKTTVIDVTPPEPIQLTKGKITTTDKLLKATGVEPNAKVYISVNGGALTAAGTADAAGEWNYPLANSFQKDDVIQLFLEDNAADFPADFDSTGLSATRTSTGNRNPSQDVGYRDATFKAATTYVVEQVTVTLHIRQMIAATTADQNQLAFPKEGYATAINTPVTQYNSIVNSGYEITDGSAVDNVEFEDFVIEMTDPDTDSLLTFIPTIPSYYENYGYIVSDSYEKPLLRTHTLQSGYYEFDFADGVYEKWITLYITPSQSDIYPFSWDYRANDLGDVKIN